MSCARAVLYGTADMQPLPQPCAEVCAVAKKDLKPGETLDAIGEYTYRAWIMTYDEAAASPGIPCGLLENGKVTKPIKKGRTDYLRQRRRSIRPIRASWRCASGRTNCLQGSN